MSGQSNVGNSQVYEAGDQKNVPRSEIEQEKKDNRFHEGKEHSHQALDSSQSFHQPLGAMFWQLCLTEDERSIANKLAREEKVSGTAPPWADIKGSRRSWREM